MDEGVLRGWRWWGVGACRWDGLVADGARGKKSPWGIMEEGEAELADFFSVLLRRRSIRSFRPEPVPPELLEEVLEAARWAPSAGNLQAWEVAVVSEPGAKRRLARAAWDQDFLAQAPYVLVVSALPERSALRYGRRGRELYCLQDATLAAGYILLAAQALGLGTCWVGAFDEEEVRRIAGFGREHRPVAVIPLGYPAENPSPPPRLPLEELVRWE